MIRAFETKTAPSVRRSVESFMMSESVEIYCDEGGKGRGLNRCEHDIWEGRIYYLNVPGVWVGSCFAPHQPRPLSDPYFLGYHQMLPAE